MVRKVPKLALWSKRLQHKGDRNYDYQVQTRIMHYACFLFSHHCLFMLLIWSKNWNYVDWLRLFSIRIKFGQVQIRMPKIGILMSKTASINPWYVWSFNTIALDHICFKIIQGLQNGIISRKFQTIFSISFFKSFYRIIWMK